MVLVLLLLFMFTGIIEAISPLQKKTDSTLCVARPKHFSDLKKGQSIAVNGACLSIVYFDEKVISFDIAEETWAKTNLATSEKYNLERALLVTGRFEGHVVLGHVDGVGKFFKKEGERFHFFLPSDLIKYCTEKGSITLNGISLTLASVFPEESRVEVAIIPTTEKETNIAFLEEGEKVNVEADYMAKLLFQWKGK